MSNSSKTCHIMLYGGPIGTKVVKVPYPPPPDFHLTLPQWPGVRWVFRKEYNKKHGIPNYVKKDSEGRVLYYFHERRDMIDGKNLFKNTSF